MRKPDFCMCLYFRYLYSLPLLLFCFYTVKLSAVHQILRFTFPCSCLVLLQFEICAYIIHDLSFNKRMCLFVCLSYNPSTANNQNIKPQVIFYGCTARFLSDLVGIPDDRVMTWLICSFVIQVMEHRPKGQTIKLYKHFETLGILISFSVTLQLILSSNNS